MIGEPLMATGFGELKVFSGSAHGDLTREIASVLGVPVGQARLRRFPDTEVSFQIEENIRGGLFLDQEYPAGPEGGVDDDAPREFIEQHVLSLQGLKTIAADVPLGTPANKEMLRGAGLGTPAVDGARPTDLIIVADADDDADPDEVLAAAGTLHPALEVPDSRFEDFARVGAAQLIAEAHAFAHEHANASASDTHAVANAHDRDGTQKDPGYTGLAATCTVKLFHYFISLGCWAAWG